jgi:Flp pilus assembly protein TadG
MKTLSKISLGAWRSVTALIADCRGVAATEFAVVVPIMLVMFFGTVEFSSGVAVDRKVTLMARTLSDLASQSTSVDDTAIANFFAASGAIMTPYDPTPVKATISELFIDPSTLQARVQWSKPYGGGTTRAQGSSVAIPTALAVGGTYLIFSEVSYRYTPTIGYVMAKTGINLSNVAYTRPRDSLCVFYSPATSCTTL